MCVVFFLLLIPNGHAYVLYSYWLISCDHAYMSMVVTALVSSFYVIGCEFFVCNIVLNLSLSRRCLKKEERSLEIVLVRVEAMESWEKDGEHR